MIIKYRPHRGTLSDAMKEVREFSSIDEMFQFIIDNCHFPNLLSKEDLIIGENLGKDDRIEWKECRHVCTRRLGTQTYDVPQCIGMCSMEDAK